MLGAGRALTRGDPSSQRWRPRGTRPVSIRLAGSVGRPYLAKLVLDGQCCVRRVQKRLDNNGPANLPSALLKISRSFRCRAIKNWNWSLVMLPEAV